MGCHELIILIRSSGNALCFRCWEYSAAPLAPSPVFLLKQIKFSEAKTKTSISSTSFALSPRISEFSNTMQSLLLLLFLLLADFAFFIKQGGITCGAIDEPRKSSKAIDEHIIINFRDKNVVIARFRDKNVVIARFRDKNVVIVRFRDKTAYV